MRDFNALLEHSYKMTCEMLECPPDSRLDFLGDHVFDFTTYDSAMSELFAAKAVEVCAAISNRETFDYIKDPENYKWFLLMCNMPFFAGRLSWGGSIRGAWWDHKDTEFTSTMLWEGDEQLLDMTLTPDEWAQFAAAIVTFGGTT